MYLSPPSRKTHDVGRISRHQMSQCQPEELACFQNREENSLECSALQVSNGDLLCTLIAAGRCKFLRMFACANNVKLPCANSPSCSLPAFSLYCGCGHSSVLQEALRIDYSRVDNKCTFTSAQPREATAIA